MGEALRALREAGASIGDRIKVEKPGKTVEGILMPRIELGDRECIVVKLSNGYNVGVKADRETRVKVLEKRGPPAEFKPPLPEENPELPLVEVLGTGGTIASRVEYRTGAVYPSLSTEELYRAVPELAEIARIRAKVLYSLLSENMTPQIWSSIARAVAEAFRREASGVVIAHGTDTMGYTAAALSFALQNLPAPVVLVGSQRSSDRPSSDAALNLMGAVRAAAYAPFAEVTVAMHEWISDETIVLHRGTKVRKLHTSRRDAFKSVNAKPLARIVNGQIVMLTGDYRPRNPEAELKLEAEFEPKVALIKFYPGFNPEVLDWYVDKGYRGIILEGTGLGHVSEACYPAIRRAVEKGVLVGMTSQCLWGRVRLTVYETGRRLLSLGVIPLGDMLPETALVKAMWVLARTKSLEEAEALMLENLAGEISYREFPESLGGGRR
ncbi:MAG: Glu-tRNA(Gln) amidotransferase GatDE subunit D [Candidatus Hecatellales archaeon]|nr:MAG: Glu-tRNA(Gln) amidotransferase GatDE subunit D [Candidatus Hecatellales archaeon]